MTETIRNKGKIALIGGDLRQLSASDELEVKGYFPVLYGFDTYRKGSDLESALYGADALLLPVPVMRGDYINMPLCDRKTAVSELISILDKVIPDGKGKLAAGGKIPPELTEYFVSKGYRVCDLCENETFNYLNAVPTAEGAIALAMSHTPVTLDGSRCAVLGYGRIGRCLSRRLKALGSLVTVAARKEKDRAEAESEGYFACGYSALTSLASDFDVVFNTVPQIVLTEDILGELKAGVPIIELASRPGGVDAAAALRCESRVISAQSLPGRVAPVSAGKIIARCLLSLLESEDGE